MEMLTHNGEYHLFPQKHSNERNREGFFLSLKVSHTVLLSLLPVEHIKTLTMWSMWNKRTTFNKDESQKFSWLYTCCIYITKIL